MIARRPAWIAIAGLILAGCEGVLPGIDWQQMIDQHKFQPFEPCPFFPDGRAMQTPPEGTVPRDRVLGSPDLTEGIVGGRYVERIPLPLTRELLATGRIGFETYCAACHGADGSGRSEVARNMELRKPPSLIDDPVLGFPAGRIFQVATVGYGLMPAYSIELPLRDRWATVAWLRVLQLRRSVKLTGLPPDLREAADKALASHDPGLVDEPAPGERPFQPPAQHPSERSP